MASSVTERIRRADEADLTAVLAIEAQSFPDPWNDDFFRHELFNPISRFYVIEIDTKIVGYIIFWIVADESHIANIAVHPKFRSAGLGGKLLNFTFDMAERNEARTITLEVNEHNAAARRLYEKYRFELTGRRPRYYANRDDALILTRLL